MSEHFREGKESREGGGEGKEGREEEKEGERKVDKRREGHLAGYLKPR